MIWVSCICFQHNVFISRKQSFALFYQIYKAQTYPTNRISARINKMGVRCGRTSSAIYPGSLQILPRTHSVDKNKPHSFSIYPPLPSVTYHCLYLKTRRMRLHFDFLEIMNSEILIKISKRAELL